MTDLNSYELRNGFWKTESLFDVRRAHLLHSIEEVEMAVREYL
jgi:hypothetical protein